MNGLAVIVVAVRASRGSLAEAVRRLRREGQAGHVLVSDEGTRYIIAAGVRLEVGTVPRGAPPCIFGRPVVAEYRWRGRYPCVETRSWRVACGTRFEAGEGWARFDAPRTQKLALALARGDFQRALLRGDEALSGSTLRGGARDYRGRYRRSAEVLLARLEADGFYHVRLREGRRVVLYLARRRTVRTEDET